jgi:hypothetical protein
MDLVKRNFKLRVIARKLLSIRPQADLVQQALAADSPVSSLYS